MFRLSAPVEGGRKRSLSGRWIRRLTGATKPSDGPSKPLVGDPKAAATKPRSPPIPTAPPSRPQITIPAHGYISSRKPSTPKQANRRPTTPKQTGRRPVTPKRSAPSQHIAKHTSRLRRPGSAKSTRSTRSKMDVAASLESDGSPAYLSCLDDIFSPPPEPTQHVLYITEDFAQHDSRAVSPALPSATSWTLEKSLDDLWGWRDVHDDPTDRLSKSSASPSDSTLADESEALTTSTEDKSFHSIDPIPIIKPLHIARPIPTLSLPPRRRNVSHASSNGTISPSTTVAASPTADPKHSDVWTVVAGLRDCWNEDADGVWRWAQRLSPQDDIDDGLLARNRLSAREKRLGNYI